MYIDAMRLSSLADSWKTSELFWLTNVYLSFHSRLTVKRFTVASALDVRSPRRAAASRATTKTRRNENARRSPELCGRLIWTVMARWPCAICEKNMAERICYHVYWTVHMLSSHACCICKPPSGDCWRLYNNFGVLCYTSTIVEAGLVVSIFS